MWWKKFFITISGFIPPALVINMDALAQLDPHRISVENVRSVLRVPLGLAQLICDIAVRHGDFRRIIAIECPDGSDGAEAEREEDLPPTVTCYAEENGFTRETEIPSNRLRRVTFYRLANG